MKRVLTAASVAALLLTTLGRQPSAASGVSYLKVYPTRVHSGDTIYVSGTNLVPRQQLWFIWACPNWDQQNSAFQNFGTQAARPGPHGQEVAIYADDQGSVVGVPISVHLGGRPASGCQVYVKYPLMTNPPPCSPLCPDIAGQFAIVKATLHKCDVQICAQIIPRPQTIHAGFAEGITIKNGWGGAVAHVKLVFDHPPAGLKKVIALKTLTLDSNGQAHTRVYLSSGYAHAGKVTIQARFSLGAAHGTTSASFTVVR